MRQWHRHLAIALGLAVIVLAGVATQSLAQDEPDPGEAEYSLFVPAAYRPAKPTPVPRSVIYGGQEAPTAGDPAAPVKVYEFSDYQCPACRVFAITTVPALRKSSYVTDGQVALVFVDFPLPQHQELSLVSHEAAHCAEEQGRYWEMHDTLYQHQDDLYYGVYPHNDAVAVRDAVVPLGVDIGLDGTALRSCLDSERYRDRISKLMAAAIRQDDVGATPTIIVDGPGGKTKLVGVYSFGELSRFIDNALEQTGAPAPALPRKGRLLR